MTTSTPKAINVPLPTKTPMVATLTFNQDLTAHQRRDMIEAIAQASLRLAPAIWSKVIRSYPQEEQPALDAQDISQLYRISYAAPSPNTLAITLIPAPLPHLLKIKSFNQVEDDQDMLEKTDDAPLLAKAILKSLDWVIEKSVGKDGAADIEKEIREEKFQKRCVGEQTYWNTVIEFWWTKAMLGSWQQLNPTSIITKHCLVLDQINLGNPKWQDMFNKMALNFLGQGKPPEPPVPPTKPPKKITIKI